MMDNDDFVLPGPDGFAAYIDSCIAVEGEKSPCGVKNDATWCPLAVWIMNMLRSGDVAVDLDTIWINGDELDTPVWMYHVIQQVDAWMDDDGSDVVTAGRMREILAGLQASMEQLPHE